MERWDPTAEGVVIFPDGARVRGRGLRGQRPVGPDPTFGVYLLGREPDPMPWPCEWIPWPDFRRPADPAAALEQLSSALRQAGTERVEIACGGGRGRTGTALAAMAVMSGVAPGEAVAWIRRRYHPKAVETPWQRRWIEHLPPVAQR